MLALWPPELASSLQLVGRRVVRRLDVALFEDDGDPALAHLGTAAHVEPLQRARVVVPSISQIRHR